MQMLRSPRSFLPATPHSLEQHENARDFSVVCHPLLQRLADYWLARRAGRVMPARRDIDPLDIPWALSRTYVVDCQRHATLPGGWRYRFRVAGTEIDAAYRQLLSRAALRHAWLDEVVSPEILAPVQQRWRQVSEFGHILHIKGRVYRLGGSIVQGSRLLLPLADGNDDQVTAMLGMTICNWDLPAPLPMPGEPDVVVTHIPVQGLA